jgi:colanic acid biosynthesis glycosyl transferase WcaI
MQTQTKIIEGGLVLEPLNWSHLDEVVTLHQNAFPDSFLTLLGPGFLRELYSGFLMDPLVIATIGRLENGTVLGSVVGPLLPNGFFRRLLQRRWWAFCLNSLRMMVAHPTSIPRLARALFYRGGAPDETDRALLSTISVSPLAQRRGVGRALLEHWRDLARRCGCPGCFLTTDAEKNDTVNRFYLSLGWDLHSTYATPEHRRMNLYVYDFQAEPLTDEHQDPDSDTESHSSFRATAEETSPAYRQNQPSKAAASTPAEVMVSSS